MLQAFTGFTSSGRASGKHHRRVAAHYSVVWNLFWTTLHWIGRRKQILHPPIGICPPFQRKQKLDPKDGKPILRATMVGWPTKDPSKKSAIRLRSLEKISRRFVRSE